jgi:hypothetical protein
MILLYVCFTDHHHYDHYQRTISPINTESPDITVQFNLNAGAHIYIHTEIGGVTPLVFNLALNVSV